MKGVLALVRIVPSWCYWILVLVALCLGCEIHGASRVQKKWDMDKSIQKKLLVIATERADMVEKEMRVKIEEINNEKNTKQANIQRRLNAALAELRNRPERRAGAASEGAGTSGQCAGASGAELSKSDAEFLEREAARADRYVIEMNSCNAQYDVVIQKMNELSKQGQENEFGANR